MKILKNIFFLLLASTCSCGGGVALDPNVGDNIGPDRTSENATVSAGTEDEEEETQKPDLNPEAGANDEYEWDRFGLPMRAIAGQKWVLNEALSDEFNYDFAPSSTRANFGENDRWYNYYHGNWSGPAPTYWVHENVWVEDGNLKIVATRPEDAALLNVESGEESAKLPATHTACITSNNRVSYPAFVEARVKLSNSTMASDVWMLSPDDTQEIDICEAYGSARNTGYAGRSFYGETYLHLSHHVFIRSPFQDYQPLMMQTWYQDEWKTVWREDYHRIGVYWRDAWNLEYYVDGRLVRVVSGKSIIDPNDFTGGTGLTKEMDIIINMEDQSWRAIGGMSPTDDELENRENSTFNVDWIRVYNPVLE